jgi:hypothetical protein
MHCNAQPPEAIPVRRFTRLSTLLLLALLPSSCTNAELEARQWDEIQQLQTTIVDLRAEAGDLVRLVDSLTRQAARQDTAIRLLADFTGAIVPGYRQ